MITQFKCKKCNLMFVQNVASGKYAECPKCDFGEKGGYAGNKNVIIWFNFGMGIPTMYSTREKPDGQF